MGVNVKELLDELGVKNPNVATLVEAENKALDALTKAQERFEAATARRQEAEDQPNVQDEAMEFVRGMEKLGLDEKVIRSALKLKYGVHRSSKTDEGANLTDEVKVEMRKVVDESGEDGFTTKQLVDQFDVKRSQVSAWIKSLVEAAEVEQTGSKRGTKYYLAGMVPETEETEAA